jgi:hypothetical protein
MSSHAQRKEYVADDHGTDFLAYRLSTETFLRGVDLLNEAVGGNISHGLLLSALWCIELRKTVAPPESLILPAAWNRAMSIHDLARALAIPYSTVYRQLGQLIKRGIAIRDGTITLSPAFADSSTGRAFRQGMMASFTRLVISLHRIGFLSGSIAPLERKDGLAPAQQDVVFRAGMETILVCLLLTAQFYDDLVTGLVFKLVATANTKHLVNAAQSTTTAVPDDLRRPISVYNAAKSLHLPYETTRRIAKQLLAKNVLQQQGDLGLVVPAHVHSQTENAEAQTASFRALAAGIAQLAHAGLRLRPTR